MTTLGFAFSRKTNAPAKGVRNGRRMRISIGFEPPRCSARFRRRPRMAALVFQRRSIAARPGNDGRSAPSDGCKGFGAEIGRRGVLILAVLRVKNWTEFQHYKDRDPPWIKLHRGLLDNRDFHRLTPLAGKLLPLIWLLASERGGLLLEIGELAFRLRISEEQCASVLTDLQDKSFIVASETADDIAQPSIGKQRAEMNGFGSRHIPDKVKRAVWDRDAGKCVQCGSEENIEYDHKHPVSKGSAQTRRMFRKLCGHVIGRKVFCACGAGCYARSAGA